MARRASATPSAGDGWAGEQLSGRSSGVVVGSELNVSQLCALEAKATNSLWGCMSRNIAHRLREGLIPLCTALVRPHLDTTFGFGLPSAGQAWTNWRGLRGGGSGVGAFAL